MKKAKNASKKKSTNSTTHDDVIDEIDKLLKDKQLVTFSEPENERELQDPEGTEDIKIDVPKEDVQGESKESDHLELSTGQVLISSKEETRDKNDVSNFSDLSEKYGSHINIVDPKQEIDKPKEEDAGISTKDNLPHRKIKQKKQKKPLFGKKRKIKENGSITLPSQKWEKSAVDPKTVTNPIMEDPHSDIEVYGIDPLFSEEGVLLGESLDTVYEAEHVFFDEHEAAAIGWSPRMTEEERKIIALPPKTSHEFEENGLQSSTLTITEELSKTKSISLKDLGLAEEEWEELDFYPLQQPYSYVEILREKESLDKRYFLAEIDLTLEEQKALEFIFETMSSMTIDAASFDQNDETAYLYERIEQIMKDYDIELIDESKRKVMYYLEKISLGLGKIEPVMKDPNIEDISCDGANVPIFLYHRKYGSLKSNIEFKTEEELSAFIFRLAQKCGKHISIAEPMLDATMPDGSRIQMTLSDEVTARGSTFTIRKFREDPFSPPDLVEFNTMSSEMVAFMWMAVENGVNTLIAGGTAAGKTTALNALSLFIPRESKIVSIEETREINLPHPNWIPGVARSGFGEIVADRMVGEIDMYDLMKAALRQRPEYIIVGEIRGREAYVLFQAMATGHATYSTAHADSAQSLIHRLEGKPINIPRVMLQSLDIISIHVITRVQNKRARRCKQIIEIIDIDPTTKEILTNEVFRWEPVEDNFVYSGKSYILERIRAEKDMTREQMTQEIKNRRNIIDWMNRNNVREFREVAKIVAQYLEDPGELLTKINKDVA